MRSEAQKLADYAFDEHAINIDHLRMLRSVWRSNEKKGGASRDRLVSGCVPAIEQAARLASFRRMYMCHWSVAFPPLVRADAAILLADMCITEWSKGS